MEIKHNQDQEAREFTDDFTEGHFNTMVESFEEQLKLVGITDLTDQGFKALKCVLFAVAENPGSF